MEIKIDLDLAGIIAAATATERLQPIIDKAIAEALKSAIEDATGYRSEFRKELTSQMSQAIPHGLRIDDYAKFQQMANAAINESVHGANAQIIQTAMKAALKNVAPDVPERIKLSELMKEARYGLHKEEHEAFYAHLKMSERGGGWLSLDGNEDCRGEYLAEFCIAFNEEGDVYSLKLDGRDLTPKSLPDAVGGFDGLLLSMYVGRTSLELDMDECEVESAATAEEHGY
ncbi:hypothetical protein L1889_18100 [Paenalcaligenes niemegkensis]|uniref:hypothetical protein n=1 Tax=Paenalcaligenes niemegkensis TaxID=2895469 RepID=UPI001EE97F0B|nr:hypothetical protein [Paenalcaligenes niemegkensis]MCQ9618353.1 hypothetical protein [Paenalcaligenes niemegkensis]